MTKSRMKKEKRKVKEFETVEEVFQTYIKDYKPLSDVDIENNELNTGGIIASQLLKEFNELI